LKALKDFFSPQESAKIYKSFDIIGDIAIVRTTSKTRKYATVIADAIMTVHRNVKTVLAQTGSVHGDFRLRKLEFLSGENKTVTRHKEFECLFSVDVEKCYFSPRLVYERMRIAKLVKDGELVLNMFAGVGCFSIIAAKYSRAKRSYSIDVNPVAFEFMKENIRLNKVYGRVIPIEADARDIIAKRLSCVADRILMPLPEKALEFLPHALLALKSSGGWIHYYDFEHAWKHGSPIERVKLKVAKKLAILDVQFEITSGRVVRTTGPNRYQLVLDIKVYYVKSCDDPNM